MVDEYILLEEMNTYDLSDKVTEHMSEGWMLHQGPAYNTMNGYYMQAMVRSAESIATAENHESIKANMNERYNRFK